MSTQVNGNWLFGLLGVLALAGCSANPQDELPDGSGGYHAAASGGVSSAVMFGGGTALGGRSAAAGGSGAIPLASGGQVASGGALGLAGASTGGSSASTSGGSASATGGVGGDSATLPTDPKCATLSPRDGGACDPQGPILCPAASKACVCVPSANGLHLWNCVDVATGNGIGIGDLAQGGSSGNAGRDVGLGGFTAGGNGFDSFNL